VKQNTIYWAALSQDSPADFEPKLLLSHIADSQSQHSGSNYLTCPAIRNKHANTFVTEIPYELNVKFYEGECFSTDIKVSERQGLYENSFAFDWKIERIFFSPISQIMEVTPAYLHKTSYSQYGHAPSGAFDIGQWFRPSSPTFQLWSGQTTFTAKKGEAHLYVDFPNRNKVVLEEFVMSENLMEIMHTCTDYKFNKPKQNLSAIYEMFTKNGLKQKVIQEIRKNLKGIK
jgi:hypothetical protein